LNDEQRKAMFAKIQRIKNLPSIEKDHFLAQPKDDRSALALRLAQKFSAKASEQNNRITLNNIAHSKSLSANDVYLFDPEYKTLSESRWKLPYDDPQREQKQDEIKRKLEMIENHYDKKYRANQDLRKSTMRSNATLRRFAHENQYNAEDSIGAKDTWSLPEAYDYEKNVKKIKGFDPKITPSYNTSLWLKLYGIEEDKVTPIRKRQEKIYEEYRKLQDESERIRDMRGWDSDEYKKKKTERDAKFQEYQKHTTKIREAKKMIERLKDSTGMDFDKEYEFG